MQFSVNILNLKIILVTCKYKSSTNRIMYHCELGRNLFRKRERRAI